VPASHRRVAEDDLSRLLVSQVRPEPRHHGTIVHCYAESFSRTSQSGPGPTRLQRRCADHCAGALDRGGGGAHRGRRRRCRGTRGRRTRPRPIRQGRAARVDARTRRGRSTRIGARRLRASSRTTCRRPRGRSRSRNGRAAHLDSACGRATRRTRLERIAPNTRSGWWRCGASQRHVRGAAQQRRVSPRQPDGVGPTTTPTGVEKRSTQVHTSGTYQRQAGEEHLKHA